MISTDVDIDVFGRTEILSSLQHAPCMIDRGSKTEKHPTGVYFQNMPRDITHADNVATVDYKIAGQYGFFKIDMLNVNFYEGIRDEAHLISLMNTAPDWNLLQVPEITDQLFQLNGHSNLLIKFKPTSIEDLAIVLALIRPTKAYLQHKPWDEIKQNIWVKDEGAGYQYKKSHSTSYAVAIVVNLNLLVEQLVDTSN